MTSPTFGSQEAQTFEASRQDIGHDFFHLVCLSPCTC